MISHEYGSTMLKHREDEINECPICIPYQAIQRVREAINIEQYQDEYNDWVIEVSHIIKALEGEK